MKYAGFITGIIATLAVAILAIQCAMYSTFGIAVIFASMAVVSGYMTYCEINEIE